MKSTFFATLFFLSINLFSQDLDSVRSVLISIQNSSLELREQVMPTVKEFGFESPQMQSLDGKIRKFDSLALIQITQIIDQYGWPGKSEIGEEANDALFMVIQHAPDSKVRKKYFPLLKKSAESGESNLADMAKMMDRMLVEKGEKQVYGTQFRMTDNELVLCPIENIEEVNERRKAVGLEELKDTN